MSAKSSKAAMLALLGASLGIAPAQAQQSPDDADDARPAVDLGAAQEALDSRQIKIADPEARQHKVTDEESRQIKIGEPETRRQETDAESAQVKYQAPRVDPEVLEESDRTGTDVPDSRQIKWGDLEPASPESRQTKVEDAESRQFKVEIEESESRQLKIDGIEGESIEDGPGGGPHDAGGGPHR